LAPATAVACAVSRCSGLAGFFAGWLSFGVDTGWFTAWRRLLSLT
jgi:hypothetical protein